MNIDEIVQQLRQERNKLDAAIQALEGVSGGSSATGKRRGRPPGTATKQATSAPAEAHHVGGRSEAYLRNDAETLGGA